MLSEATRKRRLDLILRQVESLPTLPSVAMRLLSLTAAEDTHARDVVDLIRADQTLTAKVLALCRQADRGLRDDVMTVDRAVVLLGFNTIRNAVLSVKVLETFPDKPRAARNGAESEADAAAAGPVPAPAFDYLNFWRHSLAVAITAELLATAAAAPDLPPGEAFVCGLMHDVGKLALDQVLPKSFARVLQLAELNQGNLAEFERRVIGLDHHTAGKRLAEQWGLPHALQDCIWLHGTAYELLPRLEHRRLVGLVSLADLMVRQQHVGFSGNFVVRQDPRELAKKIGIDPEAITAASARLHEELERRSKALGLDDRPSRDLYLESIEHANEELGRLNSALDRRGRVAARQGQALEAIAAFHAAAAPGQGVLDAMAAVLASAESALGPGFYALLSESESDEPGENQGQERVWLLAQPSADHEASPAPRSRLIDPPPHAVRLSQLEAGAGAALGLMSVVPWIADSLLEAPDLREVKLLPLASGWGIAAVLLHDRPALPPGTQLAALTSTWGAAIAAAGQHQGARRLGEELAEANRALAEAQDRLL
jgi:HD-like signal output (HDOD) protein